MTCRSSGDVSGKERAGLKVLSFVGLSFLVCPLALKCHIYNWRIYPNFGENFCTLLEKLICLSRKLAAYSLYWRIVKCLVVTHWKHKMEILQIQRHLQEVLEVFAIPLFPVGFRDRWPTTVFNVCKVSELQWYQFLAASLSVFYVAVVLPFCLVSTLKWALLKPGSLERCKLCFTSVVSYNAGWLNDTVPWGSTNDCVSTSFRENLLFFTFFFKNNLFCEMKPGFQCLCDTAFVSYSHILWCIIKVEFLFKLFIVSCASNVYFQCRSFLCLRGTVLEFQPLKKRILAFPLLCLATYFNKLWEVTSFRTYIAILNSIKTS